MMPHGAVTPVLVSKNVTTSWKERWSSTDFSFFVDNLYFKKTSCTSLKKKKAAVAPFYFQPKEESRPLFAEHIRKIHLVTVPSPSFQALTMTLHIKLFTLFLSLASRSPESWLSCTSFPSPLDMGEQLVTAPQLQVYKPGLQSFFSLALPPLFVFIFPSHLSSLCF